MHANIYTFCHLEIILLFFMGPETFWTLICGGKEDASLAMWLLLAALHLLQIGAASFYSRASTLPMILGTTQMLPLRRYPVTIVVDNCYLNSSWKPFLFIIFFTFRLFNQKVADEIIHGTALFQSRSSQQSYVLGQIALQHKLNETQMLIRYPHVILAILFLDGVLSKKKNARLRKSQS